MTATRASAVGAAAAAEAVAETVVAVTAAAEGLAVTGCQGEPPGTATCVTALLPMHSPTCREAGSAMLYG